MQFRWLFFAVAVGFAACATPEPVVRLTPLSENVVYNGGLAAQVKEDGRVRVAAAFDREFAFTRHRLVGFRVEIQNISNQPLLVDPANFYFAACANTPPQKPLQCQPSRRAINPEQMLLALDVEHAQTEARTANQETLGTTLLFLDLAAATTSIAAGKPHATADLVAADGAAALVTNATTERSLAGASYENARATWSGAALRKTTLLPGRAVSGLVFIDRVLGTPKIILAVRVADGAMDLPFQQVEYETRGRPETTPPRFAR